jgi:pectin methylesterase-like acyl-CoA thioesterase/lysophospholipase L1-like esterase/pectate lyase
VNALARVAIALAALASVGASGASRQPVQVFVAGDSTAAEYESQRYPQLGWAMVLACAFGPDVKVRDLAMSGRSTKSFISQGFFGRIERDIRAGDVLLVQFGHNDQKSDDPVRATNADGDFRTYLMRYVDMARAKGAQPILITPVARRHFQNGVLIDTHERYAHAVREVAAQSRTPLIDLTADSMQWISSLGDAASRSYFLNYAPDDRVARFPDGFEDNTHFNEMGARKVAELVAARLAELKLPISQRVLRMRPALTRTTPLGGPSCDEQPSIAGRLGPESRLARAARRLRAPDAFPGAEGAGRFALGGRGGAVIKVTNLNDSGPGSLRAAIATRGPRTILFDVSGTIALEEPLKIEESRVTIAGQTAPGDGITLRNYPLIVAADDVVIRYIRSRLGDERRAEADAIWVNKGRRIILDHVSASWSVDETLSANGHFWEPGEGHYDLTVQWSIISESLTHSVHAKGAHGYGSLITAGNGSRVTFHHNLWAHHLGRNPRPGNPTPADRDPVGGLLEFRSNVFYDWGGKHAGYNADTGAKASHVQYNFIDNYYLRGPASTGGIIFDESNELAKAFFAGNVVDGFLSSDPWSAVTGKTGPEHRLAKPVDVGPVTPEVAWLAYDRVLAQSGASLVRDAVDVRVVNSVRERKGKLIDSQSEVGGWPTLASLPAKPDSDGDGMPDDWERAHKFKPDRADGRNDDDGDGYTNLEEYLNALVEPRAPRVVPGETKGGPIIISATGNTYATLQAAVDALPDDGGEITLAPGVYREKVAIVRPGVRLQGVGATPDEVVLVWSDGAINVGGTFRSATLSVTGDNFRADNLTIQNDYSLRDNPPSQAVALSVTADRAIFSRVRLLGAQDTLYAGSKQCANTAERCPTSRQYFRGCYIEGHVDFIFGDSKAFFDRCEIHALAHAEILLTAHSRTAPEQDSAYVFDRCRITAEPEARNIYFGRPWRDYAAVVFMHTDIDADLNPLGWREWHPGETQRLATAYYAEYRSSGKGSGSAGREPRAHRLSDEEAARWAMPVLLSGRDQWLPSAEPPQ